jgi:preprotein translocase subunit SecA
MRRFQGDRVAGIMERLKIPDDVPIEHKWVNNAVERAQRQVESQNFEIRKNVLKYDEVMNKQREVIYRWRADILHGEHISELVSEWLETVDGSHRLRLHSARDSPAQWDWEASNTALGGVLPVRAHTPLVRGATRVLERWSMPPSTRPATPTTNGSEELGPDILRQVEKSVMLSVIDNKWREHLAEMDYLRAGIGLRAMGQRDPSPSTSGRPTTCSRTWSTR